MSKVDKLVERLRNGFPSDMTTSELREAADLIEVTYRFEASGELEPVLGKKITGWVEVGSAGIELCFEDGSRLEFLAVVSFPHGGEMDDADLELQWLVRTPQRIVGKSSQSPSAEREDKYHRALDDE